MQANDSAMQSHLLVQFLQSFSPQSMEEFLFWLRNAGLWHIYIILYWDILVDLDDRNRGFDFQLLLYSVVPVYFLLETQKHPESSWFFS